VRLTPAELQLVKGVQRAYDTAAAQFVQAASEQDFQAAERWAWLAFSLVDAVDERRRDAQ
jgi:hypothetical protein